MASVTPRASVLWSDDMGAYGRDEEEGDVDDTRTRLDKTIDKIGMGSYQWILLSLCGFGWLADNMWMQAIAIILPRVQVEYSISNTAIGAVSSSMFAGMMVGAVGWGTCSDMLGRTTAFNMTLFLTALFGVVSAFVGSFVALCATLFMLGSAVGGSMPTDGTLLLEHMPQGKQYLVTALSMFFSLGSVLAAVVALLVIPQHSCPSTPSPEEPCTDNKGWQYLLIALGSITLAMFIARIVFFRLHESPRYLVHAGRHQEALESLQLISKYNGEELDLDLEDVDDSAPSAGTSNTASGKTSPTRRSPPAAVPPRHSAEGDEARVPFLRSTPPDEGGFVVEEEEYGSTGASHTQLDGHTYYTPRPSRQASEYISKDDLDAHASEAQGSQQVRSPRHASFHESAFPSADAEEDEVQPTPRLRRPRVQSSASSRRVSSYYEKRVCYSLPRSIRRPLWGWWDRMMMVLSPEWYKTSIIVWIIWTAMSTAFTMFNILLPKLLESTGQASATAEGEFKSLEQSLWDVVIFTLGGCPGAILGAYTVDSSLGKRWSLAGSTFVTALFCFFFLISSSSFFIRVSTIGINLSATTMWAVLYGWTPEIFSPEIRGSACGIASALSRVGGMIAPLLGGLLLNINVAFPVYVSIAVFIVAGFATLMLKEDEGASGDRRGGPALVH